MQTWFIEPYETPFSSVEDEWKEALPLAVAKRLIEAYSTDGQVVFDPFAGFGTVVAAAKELGRVAFGTEIDEERVAHARTQYGVELLEESAFSIDLKAQPRIDLCVFSPPYWGPCLGVDTYEEYLDALGRLVVLIRERMNPDARLVVLIQNYQRDDGLFTLAWDVGKELARHLVLQQDVIWCVDRSRGARDEVHEAADHHYCLVYGLPR